MLRPMPGLQRHLGALVRIVRVSQASKLSVACCGAVHLPMVHAKARSKRPFQFGYEAVVLLQAWWRLTDAQVILSRRVACRRRTSSSRGPTLIGHLPALG